MNICDDDDDDDKEKEEKMGGNGNGGLEWWLQWSRLYDETHQTLFLMYAQFYNKKDKELI